MYDTHMYVCVYIYIYIHNYHIHVWKEGGGRVVNGYAWKETEGWRRMGGDVWMGTANGYE